MGDKENTSNGWEVEAIRLLKGMSLRKANSAPGPLCLGLYRLETGGASQQIPFLMGKDYSTKTGQTR